MRVNKGTDACDQSPADTAIWRGGIASHARVNPEKWYRISLYSNGLLPPSWWLHPGSSRLARPCIVYSGPCCALVASSNQGLQPQPSPVTILQNVTNANGVIAFRSEHCGINCDTMLTHTVCDKRSAPHGLVMLATRGEATFQATKLALV